MKLSDSKIKEFQKIYAKEFGKEISFKDAEIKAETFVEMVKKVHETVGKDWIKGKAKYYPRKSI